MIKKDSLHGTVLALAVDPDGPLVGILLRGASGAGKTSAALHLIETCPFGRTRLVADDHVIITEAEGGCLIAAPPASLKGLIELRGSGPIALPTLAQTRLLLGIRLDATDRLVNCRMISPLSGSTCALPEYHLHQSLGVRALVRAFLSGQMSRRVVD